jgi:hypothetical protein
MHFIPELILIAFHWEQIYTLEYVNCVFISPFVWIVPVDTSDEWPKTDIWDWAKSFILFIYFYVFKSLEFLD